MSLNAIVMENLMNAFLQMQDCSNASQRSDTFAGISSYKSLIKIKGRPILPPLISDETRKELKKLKQKASELEIKLSEQKKRSATYLKSNSSPAHSISDLSPLKQSTPARPDTLQLLPDFHGKSYILSSSSDSRINKSDHEDLKNIGSDVSSQKSTSILRTKSFRSTLEQRLVNEDFMQSRKNVYGQSPIIEENINVDLDSKEKGSWSPISIDSVSLKDGKSSENVFDEENAAPASPNLMRQNSYTLLKPGPALYQYMESQKENEVGKLNSGRKTWDLTNARKNWGPNTDNCQLINQTSERLIKNEVPRSRKNSFTDDGSTSPSSYSCRSNARLQKGKNKVNNRRAKTQRNVPSPKSASSVAKFGTDQTQTQGPDATFVPLRVREELDALSALFAKMKMEHDRQKKELEERHRFEMRELEMLFKRRESELMMQGSVTSENGFGIVDDLVKRPQSAKDFYSPCFSSQVGRRTRSMDFNRRVSGRDTDLDISFQDSVQSKDLYTSKDDVNDTDTISNCSSRVSSISSDSKVESVSLLDLRKFKKWDVKPEELKKYNEAAFVITAAAKGFLTRRLLRTVHVQGLITTLKDAISCATQLHNASDLAQSDVELMKRLGRQIEAAWDAVYAVFFDTDVSTKMQLISTDRERLKAMPSKTTSDVKKRVSIATIKSLRRKSGTESLMTRSQITNGSSRAVKVRSRMVSSYPAPGSRFSLK